MFSYLRALTTPRLILWCYLIWWWGVAIPYFDPDPRLWFSSLGIAAIIGTGLLLSTAYSGRTKIALGRWVVARLYMMPFFVSSFAALIKDRGFVLVFHPDVRGNAIPALSCMAFTLLVLALRRANVSARD